jgi:hypothetical protein
MVGAKVTEIVHFALGARLAGQLFVSLKSPRKVMVEILSVASPLLLRITLMDGLVVPTVWLGKLKLSGETFARAGKQGTNPPHLPPHDIAPASIAPHRTANRRMKGLHFEILIVVTFVKVSVSPAVR